MANDIRVRQGFMSGTITDNPLTSGATTFNSAALASVVAVGSTEQVAVTLDPTGSAGAPEIVWITAHTASATSATILRGQEGTTARQHASGISWVHSPTTKDFDYRQCRLTRITNQAIANNTVVTISWTVEDSDLDGWIAVTATTLTCPAGQAGLYGITVSCDYSAATGTGGYIELQLTRSATLTAIRNTTAGQSKGMNTVFTPLLPGDTISVTVLQNSGVSINLNPARLDLFKIASLKF